MPIPLLFFQMIPILIKIEIKEISERMNVNSNK